LLESRWRNQPASVTEPENSTGKRSKIQPHCKSRKNLPGGDPKFGLTAILAEALEAVAIAVRNVSGRRRWSKLAEWLASKSPSTPPRVEPT